MSQILGRAPNTMSGLCYHSIAMIKKFVVYFNWDVLLLESRFNAVCDRTRVLYLHYLCRKWDFEQLQTFSQCQGRNYMQLPPFSCFFQFLYSSLCYFSFCYSLWVKFFFVKFIYIFYFNMSVFSSIDLTVKLGKIAFYFELGLKMVTTEWKWDAENMPPGASEL